MSMILLPCDVFYHCGLTWIYFFSCDLSVALRTYEILQPKYGMSDVKQPLENTFEFYKTSKFHAMLPTMSH